MNRWVYRMILSFIILSYVIIILTENKSNVHTSLEVLLTFGIIGIISVKGILSDNRYYSLYKIHWYFIFIFMFIAPLCQYISGYHPWQYEASDKCICVANLMITVWSLIVSFGYSFNRRFICGVFSLNEKKHTYIPVNIKSQILLFVISTFFFGVIVKLIGIRNLTSIKENNQIAASTWSILVTLFLRAVPVITLTILLLGRKIKRLPLVFYFVLLAYAVLANFPGSLSRYWILPLYFGLLLSFVPREKFRNNIFDIFVIVGLCVVFPFMTLFKRMTWGDILGGVEFDFLNIYNNVDFDAHSILCRTIDYVHNYGFQWGGQIKSVLFFFVPRAIANIKGTPSGELIAVAQNSYYTNISCPIMAEAYIDFGWVGLVVYAFGLSRFLRFVDNKYWLREEEENDNAQIPCIKVVYVFLPGFLIYIFRGALQPTFLRVMGFYLYLILIYIYIRIRRAIR